MKTEKQCSEKTNEERFIALVLSLKSRVLFFLKIILFTASFDNPYKLKNNITNSLAAALQKAKKCLGSSIVYADNDPSKLFYIFVRGDDEYFWSN